MSPNLKSPKQKARSASSRALSVPPSSWPHLQLGSVFKAGDTMCIIEAMKILNEIEADHSGTVTKILVDNGQAVEYGQPMFIID